MKTRWIKGNCELVNILHKNICWIIKIDCFCHFFFFFFSFTKANIFLRLWMNTIWIKRKNFIKLYGKQLKIDYFFHNWSYFYLNEHILKILNENQMDEMKSECVNMWIYLKINANNWKDFCFLFLPKRTDF